MHLVFYGSNLVFAEPDNARAKELLASTYDQLGYQAESGPWRDVYLSGAYELRTRVILDESRLPTPMQLPALFSSQWQHNSEWSTWP